MVDGGAPLGAVPNTVPNVVVFRGGSNIRISNFNRVFIFNFS